MSLTITPTSAFVIPSGTKTFVAAGGTAPYVFSIFAGTGSVDSVTGIYTASATPTDTATVRVTDFLGAHADATVIVDPALNFLPSRAALAQGITQTSGATGGHGSYTFSVLPGGAGGTINASTGLYTAPTGATGVDVVVVTDGLGQTAQASFLVGTPLELFCDVLQQEMGLADGRIYLWDQKIFEPKDPGLFIAVSVINPKPFGNTRTLDSSGNSVQSVNMQATLGVDIISRGPAARDRKEEIIMALNSVYSEQQQERNSFRIFPISSAFVNLSDVDGAAIPYRFSISVNIHYFVTKTQAVPYFDTFEAVAVTTEP